MLDTRRLFYDGNSQGGIMGGSLTALAPDFNRAVLGVPGMNYSTLLRRSVDFDQYAQVLYANYPNQLERPADPLADPEPVGPRRGERLRASHDAPIRTRTPRFHTVLMHVAFGDHQVANVAAEVEARTIKAAVRVPALDPGRHSDVNPYYQLPKFSTYPFAGSALVVWDSGSPTPPTTQHAAAGGRRSAQPPAQHAGRTAAEVRVPEARGQDRGHLRGRALLRERLHG